MTLQQKEELKRKWSELSKEKKGSAHLACSGFFCRVTQLLSTGRKVHAPLTEAKECLFLIRRVKLAICTLICLESGLSFQQAQAAKSACPPSKGTDAVEVPSAVAGLAGA